MAFFVELKGSDLLKAIDQINSTIDELLKKLENHLINARIVLTKVRVPNLRNNPNMIKFEKRLRKYGGSLELKVSKLQETLD